MPFTTSTGIPFPEPPADAEPTPPLAVSNDGTRFATRAGASRIGIYSTRNPQKRIEQFAIHGPEVMGAAWSSAGPLAVTGDKGRVELWDVEGHPRLVRVLEGLGSINKKPEVVLSTAFSPDGSLVAAGDVNDTPAGDRFGTIAVWDEHTGKLLWKARTKDGAVESVGFSPDGATVFAGWETGTVDLYDSRTGHKQRVIHSRAESAERRGVTASFAPDGKLATGGHQAGIVQLWNPATGAQVGHPTLVSPSPVASISFDPAGTEFATAGGSDGLAKLWSTKTQQQFGATFPGDPGQWGNAQYTPDGSKLIVVYQDGKGFVWPVSVGSWQKHACAVAGRSLTREEWSRFVGGRSYSTVCPGLPGD